MNPVNHVLCHSFSHSATHPRTYSPTHSLTHWNTHALSHSRNQPLTRAHIYALSHSRPHPFAYSATHSPTQPLTRALTHPRNHWHTGTLSPSAVHVLGQLIHLFMYSFSLQNSTARKASFPSNRHWDVKYPDQLLLYRVAVQLLLCGMCSRVVKPGTVTSQCVKWDDRKRET
jgi:hypothetical protein